MDYYLNRSIVAITSTIIFFSSINTLAKGAHENNHVPLSTQIDSEFFDSGTLSQAKIKAYQSKITKRRNEIAANIINYEKDYNNKSKKKTNKAVIKNNTIESYDLLLGFINELKTQKSKKEQLHTISLMYEMNDAILAELRPNTEMQIVREFQTVVKKIEIHKTKTSDFGEASNLVNPKTGQIFSKEKVERMKAQGIDISKFDPPKYNGVIELMDDVSKSDLVTRYYGAPTGPSNGIGTDQLHKGLAVNFPKNNTAIFDSIRKTQSKPKIIIKTFDKDGKKTRYKLKFGIELHSEPTAGGLSSALGFFVDPNKHVKNFKVIIGKMTYDQFKVDFHSYYDVNKYDLNLFISEAGSDENGNYLIFREGMVEAKFSSDDIKRVGPWYWNGVDHKDRREFRGMFVFDLWIHNTDLKEGENNKMAIRKIEGKTYPHYLQHDLGFGFGFWFRERPTDYRWSLIKEDKKDRVIFDFRSFQHNSGFDHVTFADGRWMTRKIAQLTREQISQAVKLGQWPSTSPYNYEQLIIEKLISRRNDLVKAFDLENEFSLMSVDKSVEKDAIELDKIETIPGNTSDFTPEISGKLKTHDQRHLYQHDLRCSCWKDKLH